MYAETPAQKARNNDVNIPVKRGDVIKLVVTNIGSEQLQIVNIKLFVSYPVLVDKASQSLEGDQTETSLIVDVAPEQPEQQEPEQEIISEISDTDGKNDSVEDYRQYALQLINEDRRNAGLTPVMLSENKAAQVHAEDMLATGLLSHWTSDGMKPYMKYTIHGGTGAVGQNAGMGGYTKSQIPDCQSGRYYCPALDIREQIREIEYSMIYDDASSNWGHRQHFGQTSHSCEHWHCLR